MRSRIVAGASVLLIVLAACGSASPSGEAGSSAAATNGNGGGGGGAPGTDLTACQLVTPADIEAALHFDPGTVSEGEAGELAHPPDPAANECSYLAQDWGSLVVQVIPADGMNVFDAIASTSSDDAEALDIGDRALWLESVERGHFLKGSVLVTILFLRLTEPMPFREPTIELGEAALAKL